MLKFRRKLDLKKKADRLRPAPPFSSAERTKGSTQQRIQSCLFDGDLTALTAQQLDDACIAFWAFDALYFPPSVYRQGYAPPSQFHRDLVRIALQPDFHLVGAPRDHGKTVTLKKVEAWLQLIGKINVAGIYSENLTKASNILDDVYHLIADNPRIKHDFAPEFIEANKRQYQFRTTCDGVPMHERTVMALSGKTSARGGGKAFERYDRILGDDLETIDSPLSPDMVDKRIRKWSESFKSCRRNGTMVVLGNNFDERTAFNTIVKQSVSGTLETGWHVHLFKAWNSSALWFERFPATSESELRAMCKPFDESDWQGNFQQNPTPPDGVIFKRLHYQEYEQLPSDLISVIYTDPNLAAKSKGDTTAITALGYSRKTQLWYVVCGYCKSYSNSNELLDDVIGIRGAMQPKPRKVGFDGNVNQESTWTNNVKNYAIIKGQPVPSIEYKRYRVDDLAKNAQAIWQGDGFLFPPGFNKTEEGEKYLSQVFSFAGKTAKKKDDAPDSLISAVELLYELGVTKKPSNIRVSTVESAIVF